MKAFSRKTFGEKAYSEVMHGIQSNKALVLIALSRYLGYKEKRMSDFMDYLDGVEEEFSNYEKDGVSQEKLFAELKLCEINPERIFEPTPTFKEVDRQIKINKKPVSFSQAKQLTEQLEAMREFVGGAKVVKSN